MDTWPVDQGDDATFTATLRDENGNAYTGYAGTEPITCTVWPGNELPPLTGVATADWLDATAGTIDVAIAGSGTAALVPASYDLKLEINGVSVFRATLAIGESAGATAGRTAHVTLRHLRKHYKNVDKLIARGDDPTALEARADAWDWLCDLLHRHYRNGSGLTTDFHFVPGISFGGLYPFGYYRDGRRSSELQGWLDAGRLDLTTPVLDAMACHALAQICGGQVDVGDKEVWADFAARFAARAEQIVSCLTAELDSDGDGVNDLTIRLGVADTLEG